MPSGAYGYDVNGVQLHAGTPIPNSLALIAGAVQGQSGSGGGGGIPVTITPTTVTPNFFAVTTTSSVVIPVGAINASVLILTGTGTLNSVDQPAGVPWTEPNKLAGTVTLVLASASTARVYYGT